MKSLLLYIPALLVNIRTIIENDIEARMRAMEFRSIVEGIFIVCHIVKASQPRKKSL